jgi:ABC-2 type transport system permease protein
MITPGPALRTEAHAFLGFLERQKNLVRRYWLWEAVWLVYSLVSVLSIGYLAAGLGSGIGGATPSEADVRRAELYLLVGALLWAYLSIVFMEISFAVMWERWEGTIEYTFMAPVRRMTHLLGICAFALLYGLARLLVVAAIAMALFHLDLSHADALSAVAVLLVSTLPLVGLSVLASVLPILSPERGEQMTVAMQGILLLASGVYYPVTVLPGPVQALARASPMTYTLDGIRASLIDGRGLGAVAPDLLVLLAMGVVLVPLGLLAFAWAERRAKRLGLLKRSG